MKKLCVFLGAILVCACVYASTLTSSVRVQVVAALASAGPLSTARDSVVIDYSRSMADGSGAGECDVVYHGQFGIPAGATQTIDLIGGLTNSLGQQADFVHLKVLYLRNLSDTASFTVGLGTNAWESWGAASGTISLPAGGRILLEAPSVGWPVASGASDVLAITNNGGAIASLDVCLLGTSK